MVLIMLIMMIKMIIVYEDDQGEDVYADDHGGDVYEDHLVRCCPPSPRLTHSEQMFPLWPAST